MAYERLNLKTGDELNEAVFKKIDDNFDTKQDVLVSGSNIRTINGKSILGSGGIEIKNGEAVFYTSSMEYKNYGLSNKIWTYISGKYLNENNVWKDSSGYHSYQFTVNDRTMSKIYLSISTTLTGYVQICRDRNGTFTRWRTSDNNLPNSENLAIDIKFEDIITISIAYTSDISKITVPIYQEVRTMDVDRVYKKYSFDDSIFTYKQGYYWNEQGWNASSSYHSYQMTITSDIQKFYLEFSVNNGKPANYFQVCINRGSTFTRYRSTDNNLPLGEEGEIELQEGDILTISSVALYDINGSKIYFYEAVSQVSQSSSSGGKTCMCEYNSAMTVTSGRGGLDIYLPQHSGYAHWKFVHSVQSSINCDTWRISECSKVDDNLNEIRQITTTGAEWEMALRIADRPDFIGGYAHGDEVYTSMMVFLDGAYTDITSITTLTHFNELKIIVNSTGYDPNDSTTIALYHSKELIWTKDGITVNQRVKWVNDYTLTSCYLAMMAPLKHDSGDDTAIITDTFYSDINYEPTDIPLTGGLSISLRNPIPTKVCTYGTTSGISCTMSIPKYVTKYGSGHHYFLLADNGGGNYNKMYFSIAQTGATVKPMTFGKLLLFITFNFNGGDS